MWATPFATRHEKPVYELLASSSAPGSATFSPRDDRGLEHRRSHGHEPRPGGQLDRPGGCRLPGRGNSTRRRCRCCALAMSSSRCGWRTSTGSAGRAWARSTATRAFRCARPLKANAPKIAIGPTGNGVVVWQEPDIEGVARIWARRLFGSTLDYVLPVSAETFDGAPISTDADAPSVAVSWLGQADVAYRQDAGPGSPLPGPRIFLNILPNGESKSGAEFEGRDRRRQRGVGGAVGERRAAEHRHRRKGRPAAAV